MSRSVWQLALCCRFAEFFLGEAVFQHIFPDILLQNFSVLVPLDAFLPEILYFLFFRNGFRRTLYGLLQLVKIDGLQQIIDTVQLNRSSGIVKLRIACQEYDLDLQLLFSDPLHKVESRSARHHDIADHDINVHHSHDVFRLLYGKRSVHLAHPGLCKIEVSFDTFNHVLFIIHEQ